MTKPQPKLIILKGPIARKKIPLANHRLTIGRNDSNSIVIRDNAVSRLHAEITCVNMHYQVTDLHSRNGTFVNDMVLEPEKPHVLGHGDRIQIAGDAAILLFEEHPASVSATSTTETWRRQTSSVRRGVVVDAERREVRVDGKLLNPPLSPHQFRFLALIYASPRRVFSRDEVAAYVWPGAEKKGISEEMIDALVSRVRKRLRELSSGQEYVVAMRGHGFKFVQEA